MTTLRTPWSHDAGTFAAERSVRDAEGRQVAFIAIHRVSAAQSPAEATAIADTIVRAVNAHAQLIDALRNLTHAYVGDYPMTQDSAAAGTRAYNAARALLASLDAAEAPR